MTGGAGFLGSFLVERLRAAGADVFVPLIEEYDLVKLEDIRRMYDRDFSYWRRGYYHGRRFGRSLLDRHIGYWRGGEPRSG